MVGTADGAVRAFDFAVPFRVVFAGAVEGVVSAGVGPASAGLATSVPVGAVISVFLLRRLAVARPGVNEHGCAGSTDVSVKRFPDLRPLKETIVGVVVVASPIWSAIAVYPRVVDATMRPVFPSAVLNWFPLTVNVVSPVRPISSHLKFPAYVPERSVCVEDAACGVLAAI